MFSLRDDVSDRCGTTYTNIKQPFIFFNGGFARKGARGSVVALRPRTLIDPKGLLRKPGFPAKIELEH